MMHINDDVLNEKGEIDPDKIRLVGRLGGDHYCEAFGPAIFDVKKPLQSMGIGVDQLPDHVRLSHVLSGNDLGQLANLQALPEEMEIEERRESITEKSIEDIHTLAKELIQQGKVADALLLLMTIQNNH